MLELGVTNSHTFLEPDPAIPRKEMRGNLERRRKFRACRCGNAKVEKPASIGRRPEANISNGRFVFHESPCDQPEDGVRTVPAIQVSRWEGVRPPRRNQSRKEVETTVAPV